MPKHLRKTVNAFWRQVDRRSDTECWLWTGAKFRDGYGAFGRGWNVSNRAHRAAWELAHGERVPPGMSVLHSCDNPICVNPSHLRIGTQQDNIDDARSRGRLAIGDRHWAKLHPEKVPRGEKQGSAKLTKDAVAEILSSDLSQRKLAMKFGVSHSAIGRVRSGEYWRHVPRGLGPHDEKGQRNLFGAAQ